MDTAVLFVRGFLGRLEVGVLGGLAARLVHRVASARKYWTRRGVAEWLIELLAEGPSTIVGIDHAFSFPMPYFKKHGLAPG